MGTWDSGLRDNDSSHDGLGDLEHHITRDLERFGARDEAVSTKHGGAQRRAGGALATLAVQLRTRLRACAWHRRRRSGPAALSAWVGADNSVTLQRRNVTLL